LIVLTIALAVVFLVRSSITVGATGKILAFVGLCVLPVLCIGTGWSVHQERSAQTSSCIACHSMESHGKSLYVADPSYIPAQHFQNHLVPPDKACYTCHTDYARYGSFEDKLRGLKYIYMQYVSTPPKTIHISGVYSNLQCLHCHAGARGFSDNPAHNAIMGSLTTNQISCLTCHEMIHNASEVGHLKMWVPGNAPTSPASASSSTALAKAEPAATAGPAKPTPGSSAGGATSAQGKSIFDSHGCGGCHGESGGGGSGPALTHVSSQYPPAKLTALLKAPTAKMKAAGMVALTVNTADMKALVSYVTSLGGTSAGSAATPPASAASSLAPAKAPAASPAGGAAAAQGKTIFDSQGCGGCHGQSGGGGSGPALTHVSSQYPPAKLTALLKAPTAKMKAAGMVALTVNAADMKALVSYVTSLGGASAGSAATPPASAASSLAPAKAPAASPAGGTTAAQGKSIFDSQGCGGCHGESGGGGSGPALTHVSSQYPPAKLTALLKAPTAKMKAAGMTALTVNAADMKALVSYVTSLGGTSAGSAPTPTASASSSPASATAKPAATAEPSKVATAATPPASASSSSPAPATAKPAATAEASKAPTGSSAGGATTVAAQGKSVYDSHGCGGCHGESGGGGSGPALTDISSQYPPAKLTAVLQAPTDKMKAGGMTPLTLNAEDMKALVSYVTSLGGTSAGSAATPPASASSSAAKAEPTATAGASKAESKGQAIFKAYGCADCHGTNGVGGTAAASALAGTGKSLAPALLTTILKHPTASMQQGGMPPVSASGDELKALVAYVSSISASKTNSH
jgi:mono/diheme cytochrome c family protein